MLVLGTLGTVVATEATTAGASTARTARTHTHEHVRLPNLSTKTANGKSARGGGAAASDSLGSSAFASSHSYNGAFVKSHHTQSVAPSTHVPATSKGAAAPLTAMPHITTASSTIYLVNTPADDTRTEADVTGLADCSTPSDTCTLRDAVAAADQTDGPSVVEVPPGEYELIYGTLPLGDAAGMLITSIATPITGADTTVVSVASSTTWAPPGPSGRVSTPAVTVSPATASATATYTISFTTSVNGSLATGDHITVSAPPGTVFSTDPEYYSIKLNTPGDEGNLDVGGVSTNTSGAVAVISVEGSVPGGQWLTLTVTHVENPAANNGNVGTVSTTTDSIPVTTTPYSITTSEYLTDINVATSSSAVSATTTTYSVTFTPSTKIGTSAHLSVVGPPGTTFAGGTTTDDYAICSGVSCTPTNHFTSAATSAESSPTRNRLTLVLGATTLAAGVPVTLSIEDVTNPTQASVTDELTLSSSTYSDSEAIWSRPYGLTAVYIGDIFEVETEVGAVVQVEGITMANGDEGGYGGGFYQSTTDATVILNTDIFMDDQSDDTGGGAYLADTSAVAHDQFTGDYSNRDGGGLATGDTGSTFVNDIATSFDATDWDGGGAYLAGTVTGSGVTGHWEYADECGGALAGDAASLTLSQITITTTGADWCGGGISLYDASDSLSDVTLHYTGATYGGAIADESAVSKLDDVQASTEGAYSGAGLAIDADHISVTDSSFDHGGSRFGSGVLVDYVDDATFTNVSAQGDGAQFGGGVFILQVDGALTWNGGDFGGTDPAAHDSCETATDTIETGGPEDVATFGGGVYITDGSETGVTAYFLGEETVPVAAPPIGATPFEITSGTINFDGVTIDDDAAFYQGGGIYSNAFFQAVTMSDSNVSGDVACGEVTLEGPYDGEYYAYATEGAGGGIFGYYMPPKLTGTDVDDDYATFGGGGIYDLSRNFDCTPLELKETGEYYYEYCTNFEHRTNLCTEGQITYERETCHTEGWGSTTDIDGSLSDDRAGVVGGGLAAFASPATLDHVAVDGDTAELGGGIAFTGDPYNEEEQGYSPLTVTGGSVSNDTSTGLTCTEECGLYAAGGGIAAEEGTFAISNAVFTGDVANPTATAATGGGVDLYKMAGSFTDDTFGGLTLASGDKATTGGGVDAYTSSIAVSGSTFAHNEVRTDGGGLDITIDTREHPSTATLVNDTIASNTAGETGGGIYNEGQLEVEETTIADNTAGISGVCDEIGCYGGGLYDFAPTGHAVVSFSLLVANFVTTGVAEGPNDCTSGTPAPGITSGGYNVVSDDTCGFDSVGDKWNAQVVLGPLQSNGGPTMTMAIPATSPAVNVEVGVGCITATDQRGAPRPSTINGQNGCDAGAYQVQPITPPFLVFTTEPPGTIAAGANFGVTVSVETALGTIVTTSAEKVQLGITPTTGTEGALLHCNANPERVTEGVAMFTCFVNEAGTTYRLDAFGSTLTEQRSTLFDVSPSTEVHATHTALTTSSDIVQAGSPVTFTATVSSTLTPGGGTVEFTEDGHPIAGCTAVAVTTTTGLATCTTSFATSGTYAITASYSGYSTWGSSSVGGLTQRVHQPGSVVKLTSSANPSLVGTAVTYTATVTPVPNGGTVAFTDGGNGITGCGAVVVNTTNGRATCTTVMGTVGTFAIGAAYSGAPGFGSASTAMTQVVNTHVPPPAAEGYWIARSNGAVYAFGDAPVLGTLPRDSMTVDDIVGMAATPTGNGYWLVGSDGGVFAFGTAKFYGSMGGKVLNRPIVGIASTVTGNGYWLVASDGGVFSFGTAHFYGSEGTHPLNKPVNGIAAAPTGKGYWLVASDGGVFTFGTISFHGSTGAMTLVKPVVGMAAEITGKGYWLAASDGGIFAFTAPFEGSTGATPIPSPVVGITTAPTGEGYWFVTAGGEVYSEGSATYQGGLNSLGISVLDVVDLAAVPPKA